MRTIIITCCILVALIAYFLTHQLSGCKNALVSSNSVAADSVFITSVSSDTMALPQKITPEGMDYQIVLVPAKDYNNAPDSIAIYDGKRLVGTVPLLEDSQLGRLIYDDNQ